MRIDGQDVLLATDVSNNTQGTYTQTPNIYDKNSRALIAYYLAGLSLIPFIGILLGVAAFVLGLLGLHFAKEHSDLYQLRHWTLS